MIMIFVLLRFLDGEGGGSLTQPLQNSFSSLFNIKVIHENETKGKTFF